MTSEEAAKERGVVLACGHHEERPAIGCCDAWGIKFFCTCATWMAERTDHLDGCPASGTREWNRFARAKFYGQAL